MPLPPGRPAANHRHVRLLVYNKPLPWLLRWMVREPAMQCRATVRFQRLDGREVFEKPMEGRWAGSPEPVLSPIVDPDGRVIANLIDFERLGHVPRVDVQPGETEKPRRWILRRASMTSRNATPGTTSLISAPRPGEIRPGKWAQACISWR
jgi:hypothetical protein